MSEDKEIIRKLRSGDEKLVNEATKTLHERFFSSVNKMVRLSGGTETDTLELLNDALVALVKKVQNGTFDGDKASLKTLFMAIAQKKRFDQLKNQYKKRDRHTDLENPLNKAAPKTFNPIEEFVFSTEEREKVKQALSQLDASCRELFELKYWKGISLRDIAVQLNISEDAVKKRHERCKKKLKSLLGKDPRIR